MLIKPPTATSQRDQVYQMHTGDWRAALKLAKGIEEMWFRCQALSHVASICPVTPVALGTLDEAFAAADSIKDINRKVSVSMWPIGAALTLRQKDRALHETRRFLEILRFEANPVRRMDACAWHIHRLSSEPICLQLAVNAFLLHATQARSWKVAYNVLNIAPVITEHVPERLPEFRSLLKHKRFTTPFDANYGGPAPT